ncbi:Autotransporter-associated beta strand repeat protein [Planctomycetes bacterium CA13]|uniref:Autotransporter-associated beta strand repeat protein n=1 Tax=Novipirellula herctigrandis TaxID=2527986 RepID=A0A5C5Z936_9BACT|nr:Autotransporter-associated beta strand repeat protein [Planctomycetes bacterium CA13]
MTRNLKFLLSFGMCCALATTAYADSATWEGTRSGTDVGDWSTEDNWDSPTYSVPGVDDTATFGNTSGAKTIYLGSDVSQNPTARIVVFENGASAYTIGANGPGDQTLNLETTTAVNREIIVEAGVVNNQVIDANVTNSTNNASGLRISNNSTNGATLSLNGVVNGGNKFFTMVTAAGNEIILNSTANTSLNNASLSGGGTVTAASLTDNKSMNINWGTLNLNKTQDIGGLQLGHATIGDGDATLNVGTSNVVGLKVDINYLADDAALNKGYINGGKIELDSWSTAKTTTANIAKNSNPGFTGSEVIIESAIERNSSDYLFEKSGDGTLELNGDNTYLGTTTVTAGTLLINGDSSAATGAVIVKNGATLGGTGIIGGPIIIESGGILGGSSLLDADLHFDSDAELLFSSTLSIIGDTTFDDFDVTDIIGLDNTVELGTYTLIGGTGTVDLSTGVSNVGVENAADLGEGKIAYFQYGSLQLVVAATAVPEPSTFALLGLGTVGSLAYRRRRR